MKDPRAAADLFELMKSLSLQTHQCDWAADLEFTLYEATIVGPIPLNGYWLDRIDIDRLAILSDRAGGWWFYDETIDKVRFVDLTEWFRFSGFRAPY